MTIHILLHGWSLCNMAGVPAEWPEDHKWVSLEEKEKSTCSKCRERAEELERLWD